MLTAQGRRTHSHNETMRRNCTIFTPIAISYHLTILRRSSLLNTSPRLSHSIKQWRIPILQPRSNTRKLEISHRERGVLTLRTRRRAAHARRQRLSELPEDEIEMYKAATINHFSLRALNTTQLTSYISRNSSHTSPT
jgi:hypothetical protein